MTNIIPIQGLRLSPKAGADYSLLVTPPYDVIDQQQQEECYNKSPFNVIRLEYGKSLPGDDNLQNKYTRAACTLQDWLETGVLFREKEPALYFYDQHFNFAGKKYLRRGLFCGVELTDFREGNIIPHEETMDLPKADRLELLECCQTNFSPVFGLFRDKEMFLENMVNSLKEKNHPIINFTDEDSQTHKIWATTDPGLISAARRFFSDKKILIADGHHRYETALNYYLQRKKQSGDTEKFNHVLMALTNIYDEGLLSLPTHRLILRGGPETRAILPMLEQNFVLTELQNPQDREQFKTRLGAFLTCGTGADLSLGLYTPEGKLYGLKLKNAENHPFPLIDTFALQELILKTIFGQGETEKKEQCDLIYIKDEWEAKKLVDGNIARYLFCLNSPPLEEIIDLAEKGVRLPQKSTYFYPKMISGLIMLKH